MQVVRPQCGKSKSLFQSPNAFQGSISWKKLSLQAGQLARRFLIATLKSQPLARQPCIVYDPAPRSTPKCPPDTQNTVSRASVHASKVSWKHGNHPSRIASVRGEVANLQATQAGCRWLWYIGALS